MTGLIYFKSIPTRCPEDTRQRIQEFWSIFGRTERDYLESANLDCSEYAYHIESRGFKHPKQCKRCCYYIKTIGIVKGIYVHAWNNMGRLLTDEGKVYCVSTGDMWAPIYSNEDDMI